MADDPKNLPEIASLAPFGDLLATIGTALPRAQHQIDQAALSQILTATDDFAAAVPSDAGFDAAGLARSRATFYTIPNVHLEMKVNFQVSAQHQGGLLVFLFGGTSSGQQQDLTSTVTVDLVAVPPPHDLADLVAEQVKEVQTWLRDFFLYSGTPKLSEPPHTPDGQWSDYWRGLLTQFQTWWNSQPDGKATPLVADGSRDETTLAVLAQWHDDFCDLELRRLRPVANAYLCAIKDPSVATITKDLVPLINQTADRRWTDALNAFRVLWQKRTEFPNVPEAGTLDRATLQALRIYVEQYN